jgi:putative ABC transport system permease protein
MAYNVDNRPPDLREQMYFPAQQSYRNPMAYALRSDVDPSSLVAAIRKVMADLDPSLPIYDVRSLTSYTADALAVRSFTLVLSVVFAASALILAAVGIYGVTAYAAAQRQREFGLRFALGARARQVARLVVTDAVALTGAGAMLGCAGAFIAARALRTQLYSVSPYDPFTYAVGALLVVTAAVVASAMPAYRAARTSPLDSLRAE